MAEARRLPSALRVNGARTNNLKDVDVEAPLWCVVVLAGVSGSGKTSLAMGCCSPRARAASLRG